MGIKNTENHSIMVRVDWNENRWQKPSKNLKHAETFIFVKENKISYTAFNFAQELYPPETDGLWYGLIPSFWSKTPDADKIRNLKIVFIISNHNKKDLIVGLYAFPIIQNGMRKNKIPDYNEYDMINIGAKPNNILQIQNYVDIESIDKCRYLGDQQISTQGWNYLNQSQTGYLFDSIQKINGENKQLNKIKFEYLKSNK